MSRRFGRLTVISLHGFRTYKCGQRKRLWLCVCECGKRKVILEPALKNGCSRSCGCLRREESSKRHFIHGLSGSAKYLVWQNMIKRCQNQTASGFNRYGGRGIKVCQRWKSFQLFWEDMGKTWRPGLTIERKNNNGNYVKTNCIWATPKLQARNRRSNRIITFQNVSCTLAEWSERTGFKPMTIAARLKRGWSLSDSLTQPLDARGSR